MKKLNDHAVNRFLTLITIFVVLLAIFFNEIKKRSPFSRQAIVEVHSKPLPDIECTTLEINGHDYIIFKPLEGVAAVHDMSCRLCSKLERE